MSDNITREQDDTRPFEERVLSILNELRQDVQAVDKRVQALEAKTYETKPIWERALAEITELRNVMESMFRALERKQDVFNRDLLDLRERQYQVEEIARKLDSSTQ